MLVTVVMEAQTYDTRVKVTQLGGDGGSQDSEGENSSLHIGGGWNTVGDKLEMIKDSGSDTGEEELRKGGKKKEKKVVGYVIGRVASLI